MVETIRWLDGYFFHIRYDTSMNKWRNSSGEDSAQHKYGWVWWVICPWGCVFEQPNKSDICTRHWNSTSRNWGYGLSSLADGHSERFTRTIWWPLRSESAVYIAAQTCAWVRKTASVGLWGKIWSQSQIEVGLNGPVWTGCHFLFGDPQDPLQSTVLVQLRSRGTMRPDLLHMRL